MSDTLQWLNALCEQADNERKAGNWGKMGFIASSPALKYFFDNVYKLGVNPQAFTYTGMFKEVEALHEGYVADRQREQMVTESAQRLDKLETSLQQLYTLLKPLVEAQQPAAEEAQEGETEEDPQPRKKKARKPQDAEPESPAAEPDAEGEPDEDASEEAESE